MLRFAAIGTLQAAISPTRKQTINYYVSIISSMIYAEIVRHNWLAWEIQVCPVAANRLQLSYYFRGLIRWFPPPPPPAGPPVRRPPPLLLRGRLRGRAAVTYNIYNIYDNIYYYIAASAASSTTRPCSCDGERQAPLRREKFPRRCRRRFRRFRPRGRAALTSPEMDAVPRWSKEYSA